MIRDRAEGRVFIPAWMVKAMLDLRLVLENPEAMAALERIEGWRALGGNIIETIINKSEKVKELKNKAKNRDLTSKENLFRNPYLSPMDSSGDRTR